MTKESLKLPSTYQEYWDACLIKTWRTFGTITHAMSMFSNLTGKRLDEFNPPLLRTPLNLWHKMGVRVFAYKRLSKINNWLLKNPPEKDVLLLRKLKNSKYDLEKDTINDNALSNERRKLTVNTKRAWMDSFNYSNRNQKTDWRVTK